MCSLLYYIMKDPIAQIDEYAKEIEMDTSIDVTNIMEKQLSCPNTKHKWLFKLIKAKKNLIDLVEAKDFYIQNKLAKDNPLNLSKSVIANKAESQMEFRALQKSIKEQELLVEYLDSSVNKIFSQMGFDFKNLVDLLKMEQL